MRLLLALFLAASSGFAQDTEPKSFDLNTEQKLELRDIQLKRQGLLTQLIQIQADSEEVRNYLKAVDLLEQINKEYSAIVDNIVLQYITEEDKANYILDKDLVLKPRETVTE